MKDTIGTAKDLLSVQLACKELGEVFLYGEGNLEGFILGF